MTARTRRRQPAPGFRDGRRHRLATLTTGEAMIGTCTHPNCQFYSPVSLAQRAELEAAADLAQLHRDTHR